MLQKVSSSNIPDEIKKEIQEKIVVDYVKIGDSFYKITPLSIIRFLNLINEATKLVQDVKENNKRKENVSIYDVLSDETFKNRLINILMKIFEGVDKVDFENMSIVSFNKLLEKMWKVNLDAFESEEEKQKFISKIYALALLINPNLYNLSATQKVVEDIRNVLQNDTELAQKFELKLKEYYEKKTKDSELKQ